MPVLELSPVQNRVCTVADSLRVAEDMGKIQAQLHYWHRPVFGWKGSYVVSKVGEMDCS